MVFRALGKFAFLLPLLAVSPVWAKAPIPAKQLFGKVVEPAALPARSIGSYAAGCMAGGVALPIDGPQWQVMRLSRNRKWGQPILIDLLKQLARDGAAMDGWRGLLVGDMGQPRGGPMITGHASHQIGLDADIWLIPKPRKALSVAEREEISATYMLKKNVREVDPRVWSDDHARIIRRAASYPEVSRVFVHPAIKKALCDFAGTDRSWLRKVRPWWGHDHHFHLRLSCPPGQAGCKNQAPPPPGDGCGSELTWWLGPEPWIPSKKPVKPRRPMMLRDLPAACTDILYAHPKGK